MVMGSWEWSDDNDDSDDQESDGRPRVLILTWLMTRESSQDLYTTLEDLFLILDPRHTFTQPQHTFWVSAYNVRSYDTSCPTLEQYYSMNLLLSRQASSVTSSKISDRANSDAMSPAARLFQCWWSGNWQHIDGERRAQTQLSSSNNLSIHQSSHSNSQDCFSWSPAIYLSWKMSSLRKVIPTDPERFNRKIVQIS